MLILIKPPPLKPNVQFEILLLSCLPLIYGKYQTFLTEPFAYRQSMFFAGKNGGDVIFLKHTLGSSLFTMLLLLQRLKKGGHDCYLPGAGKTGIVYWALKVCLYQRNLIHFRLKFLKSCAIPRLLGTRQRHIVDQYKSV